MFIILLYIAKLILEDKIAIKPHKGYFLECPLISETIRSIKKKVSNSLIDF